MRARPPAVRFLLPLLAPAMFSCCSSDGPAGPSVTTGTITVSVVTTGPDAPASYTLTLGDSVSRSVNANGSTNFTASGGSHTLHLTGVPTNCSVAGTNPQPVRLQVGSTASVGFAVSCESLTGSIVATTATTGDDVDPDGYVLEVDGGSGSAIGIGGSLTLPDVDVGVRSIELTDVAANCMAAGDNPRTVDVGAAETTSVRFEVACSSASGSLEVTVEATGVDVDPDGYTANLDGASTRAVAAGDTATFTGVAAGPHAITLEDVAANCAVAGDNPAAAVVAVGATASVRFDVACTQARGNLRVTANTRGDATDPDGYTVSVDGGAAVGLAIDADTLTFASLRAGGRVVALGDLEAGCVAVGGAVRTAPVVADTVIIEAFEVICSSMDATLEVTTVTTGDDLDPDGYALSLDAGTPLTIGANEVDTLEAVAPGAHALALADVAANCAVRSGNPQNVAAPGGVTTAVAFEVDCTPLPNSPPTASILAPSPSPNGVPFTALPGESVTFTGSATDTEDGMLSGAALVWTSNMDGQIGTGASFSTSMLSEGMHTVTLVAVDSDLASDSRTILVVIAPPSQPGFQVTLRLAEGVTLSPPRLAAITNALSRLEAVITGDLPDRSITYSAGNCVVNIPATSETVDDVLMFLEVVEIDGPLNTLGAAGPCVLRDGSHLPVIGGMRFDSADLDFLDSVGLLEAVLLHEAMHILGFGTIWTQLGLLEDPSSGQPGADTWFSGAAAHAAFLALGGAAYTGGAVVPVENDTATYGGGSLDTHWRESVFAAELMTPSVGYGTNPLSILTVGQFEDLGYVVDPGAADPYAPVFPSAARASLNDAGPTIHLDGDAFIGPLWEVAPSGAMRRLR